MSEQLANSVRIHGYKSHKEWSKKFTNDTKCPRCLYRYQELINFCYSSNWTTDNRAAEKLGIRVRDHDLLSTKIAKYNKYAGFSLIYPDDEFCHIRVAVDMYSKTVVILEFRCSYHSAIELERAARLAEQSAEAYARRPLSEFRIQVAQEQDQQMEKDMKNTNTISAWDILEPVHPGAYIRNGIAQQGSTNLHFAKACGLPEERIKSIVGEETLPTAVEIAAIQRALGIESELIAKLSKVYEIKKAGGPAPA